MNKSLAAFALVAAFAAGARGQCDTGDWLLTVDPNPAMPGDTVTICLTGGPPNEVTGLLISDGPGPTDLGKYGVVCLDFPVLNVVLFTTDASGSVCITANVPCDPEFNSFVLWTVFLTCDPFAGSTNTVKIEFNDIPCFGEFCSYGQFTWGDTCSAGNIACLRDSEFATVFPSGLVLGDPDGPDADSCFSLTLTSAAAVEAFLPSHGQNSTLTSDLTDPPPTGGNFGGLLAAGRLNVAFDDANLFDPSRSNLDHRLGDLVYVSCVNPVLFGHSIRELLDLADQVFCGTFGQCDGSAACFDTPIVDFDGDGNLDLSMHDVLDGLRFASCTFIECEQNLGCLGFP